MSKELPPLARTVLVGSTAYTAGDVPPLHHARRITNPKNWTGEKVPNFDDYEDGDGTSRGVTNGDAANAGRSGLPGFGGQTNAADTESADATGAAAVAGEGSGDAANAERNNDPDGTGVAGAGESEGSDPGQVENTGTAPARTTTSTSRRGRTGTSGS